MPKVQRGSGTTKSERYLAGLAEKSFLNLWTYPNVYRDQGGVGSGDGKEVCDLLVVCGDDVLVFSDKTITWPTGCDLGVAWQRWFKRAVWHSLKQVQGAMRWIEQFPERLFIDRRCTQRLPIPLPPPNRRRVHGIIVALGAGDACREHFGGGSGSLMVTPRFRGEDHLQSDASLPFTIGDIHPDGPFVHVFDDTTLDVVMSELDTVVDLTEYLLAKERFIRGDHLVSAAGEEELVAYYMTHMSLEQRHDFTTSDGKAFGALQSMTLEEGSYANLRANPQYVAKRRADRVSYTWDRLVEHFTALFLDGTALVPSGEHFDLGAYEAGVRYMARTSRFARRQLGAAFVDAMEKGRSAPRFARVVFAHEDAPGADTGFFFMTLALPDSPVEGGYERYRVARQNMLHVYALQYMRQIPHLERIIGIASEPPAPRGPAPGSSQDLIFATRPDWTDELVRDLEADAEMFGILRPGGYEKFRLRGDEFPDVYQQQPIGKAAPAVNRKARRTQEAKARRTTRKGPKRT